MSGARRFYLIGLTLLLALAGCGRSMLQTGERQSWRHQAEASCMQSGAVKLGAGVVQIEPIEGPGMCGADFPLKVAALGEAPRLAYGDEVRPPASIPNVSSEQMPRWPVNDPRYGQQTPVQVQPVQTQPAQGARMRWVPGAQPVNPPQESEPDEPDESAGQPVSLDPPGAPSYREQPVPSYRPQTTPAYRPQAAPAYPAQGTTSYQRDDIPDDAVVPQGRAAPRTQPAYNAPVYQQPEPERAPPALGPMRGPQTTAGIMPATLTPAATLSCPIVSALDRWVSEGVQPAALHWFGVQVVTIKQISAYSCRGMVGAGISHISEHAFGNALDVAGFVLADGRKISVQEGWRGSPEEQGFLHDVQLYACETFTTVLAPGYNAEHYNHIHVDLMRRASGRRPCRPNAIPGEVVAAKARAVYASKQRGPAYTGSIPTKAANGKTPSAIPGEDGYVADEDDDAGVTGSISPKPSQTSAAVAGADGEFDDDDVQHWPRVTGAALAGDAAIRAQERRSQAQ
jgi:hypothetical protein